jgi:spore maturation protein CgeB
MYVIPPYAVLASTIAAQSVHSMVNNRIFEALSCGAIVISVYSVELSQLGKTYKNP